jgi:uncharacterized membrane protein
VLRHRHDLQRLTSITVRSPQRIIIATIAVAIVTAWWFYLGSASVSAQIESGTLGGPALAALGVLAVVNFGALILAALAVRLDRRVARIFVVVVLAANVISAFLDQVGPLDIAYAVAAVLALVLVLWSWRPAHSPVD